MANTTKQKNNINNNSNNMTAANSTYIHYII